MKRNFKIALIIAVLIVVFLTFMDLQGYAMWQTVGGFSSDVYIRAQDDYMIQFWSFATALIVLVAGMYYLFRRDLSETIAVALTSKLLLMGGLEDLLYYIFGKFPFENMPWLYEHLGVGTVAKVMGLETVTPTSLIISVLLFGTLAYFSAKWLEKQKKW